MTNVMEGIRILEVAEHTFVPAASAILADWGAEVIKVEHVERGDAMRGLGTTGSPASAAGPRAPSSTRTAARRASASTSPTPKARHPLPARRAVRRLPHQQDARRARAAADRRRGHPGPQPEHRLRAGHRLRQPRPRSRRRRLRLARFWARAGVRHAATPPDLDHILGQPAPAFGDSIGAMTIAGGISAALLHRERTGEAGGRRVAARPGMWAMGGGIALPQLGCPWAPIRPAAAARRNPLVGIYRTSDGRFITFSMLQGFHYWPEICDALGRRAHRRPALRHTEPLRQNGRRRPRSSPRSSRAHTLDEWSERFAHQGPVGARAGHARGRRRPAGRRPTATSRTRDGRHPRSSSWPRRSSSTRSPRAATRARVQRARRRHPHRGARPRLGHGHRPQGQRRRRLIRRRQHDGGLRPSPRMGDGGDVPGVEVDDGHELGAREAGDHLVLEFERRHRVAQLPDEVTGMPAAVAHDTGWK